MSSGVAIVDDDVGYADLLAELIELDPRFHVVGSANTVSSGLELLLHPDVDVGLVDVNMPDGGGLAVVASLHLIDRPLLILISAEEPSAAVRRAGVAFVHKSVLDGEHLARVGQCS